MPSTAEVPVTNYEHISVAQINALGTEALRGCVQQEFSARGYEDDPEVAWALDFSMRIHQDQKARSDGPFINHPLRATLYGMRLLGPHDPATGCEIAKTLLLHDVFEDRPKLIIETFGGELALEGATNRERALSVFRQRQFLRQPNTLEALSRLTCPPFKNLAGREKWLAYGRHVVERVLPHPLAALAKLADHIDNGLELIRTPDSEKRRKLDLKYFPLHEAFRNAVEAPGSLVPAERRDNVIHILQTGHAAVRERLQTYLSDKSPALTHAQLDELADLLETA